jgi:uncharacterized protein
MKIFLRELSDLETELDFTQEDPWVVSAVLRVDEHAEDHKGPSKPRPIRVHFSLRKVDEVIVTSGKIDTFIELICSRCANSFQKTCDLNFSALFCKDPVMAGIAHLQGSDRKEPGRPVGQNQGYARHAHNEDDDELISSGKDLDITYLSHEYIDLGEVLTEQLQFQVPFQPLCKEDCKGICPHCGTDLNIGRCACAKIKKTSPFSVLNDFKI